MEVSSEAAVEISPVKRGRGRPRKTPLNANSEQEGLTNKRKRVSVDGQRDRINVQGKDPNFYYRWVKDSSDTGSRILTFIRAGYDFVKPDEVDGIGADTFFQTKQGGTVIRETAGNGDWLYLMKQPMEYRLEDEATKAKKVNDQEAIATEAPDGGDMFYGNNIQIKR